jgi:hypothetical protein
MIPRFIASQAYLRTLATLTVKPLSGLLEITSPTQPFPTRPAQFDRNGIGPDDVNDLTPKLPANETGIPMTYLAHVVTARGFGTVEPAGLT